MGVHTYCGTIVTVDLGVCIIHVLYLKVTYGCPHIHTVAL